jgi:hypothetical protein
VSSLLPARNPHETEPAAGRSLSQSGVHRLARSMLPVAQSDRAGFVSGRRLFVYCLADSPSRSKVANGKVSVLLSLVAGLLENVLDALAGALELWAAAWVLALDLCAASLGRQGAAPQRDLTIHSTLLPGHVCL